MVCVDDPELKAKEFEVSAGEILIWGLLLELPSCEAVTGPEPGTIPGTGEPKGLKGDAVASSFRPLPKIGLIRGASDSEPDCICSSPEPPSTNSDSSLSVDIVSASVSSSTKPWAWA